MAKAMKGAKPKAKKRGIRGARKETLAMAGGAWSRAGDRVTVGVLRQMMREFVRERAWEKYHTPRNLAASVAVEAGELLELFQWWTAEEGDMRKKELTDDALFRKAVGEEMSDVLMYLMSLANAMDLDIGEAVYAKMEKNRMKYPAEEVRGHYDRRKRLLAR